MKLFFKNHWFAIIVLVIIIVVATFIFDKQNTHPAWTTAAVDKGVVSQIISVSGTVDAVKTAELSFPISGVVESINVSKGQTIEEGVPLITLKQDDLRAEYQSANSNLLIAKANQSETLTGARTEEREIASTKVKIAEEELDRIKNEQAIKVDNAYKALLSTDLISENVDSKEESAAPTVTGTYKCGEGSYTLDVFGSSANSGFSYRLSGLESGTYTAYTDNAAPVGTCGLFIKFVEGERYNNSEWKIQIPNTRSSFYVSNLNAYNLALTTQKNTVAAAIQNLDLAKQNENLIIANPRSESVSRDKARVIQAQAELARITSQMNDHTLISPFAGVVTEIKPSLGETVGLEPVITMVSDDIFEITALIPEIDITKIFVGQKSELIFDAHNDEILNATITFVSPLAQTIAGVSYFETTMILDTPVDWLRGGLNADINVIAEEYSDVLRIPKRFLIEDEGIYSVLIPNSENTTKSVPVTVDFIGNDGYVAIQGLNNGDTVVAP